MTNEQQQIEDAFAPVAWPADPPHQPPRSAQAQVQSDRLREKARAFAQSFIGLVQDPGLHALIIPQLGEMVVSGELVIAKRYDIAHPTHQYLLDPPTEPAAEGEGDEVGGDDDTEDDIDLGDEPDDDEEG